MPHSCTLSTNVSEINEMPAKFKHTLHSTRTLKSLRRLFVAKLTCTSPEKFSFFTLNILCKHFFLFSHTNITALNWRKCSALFTISWFLNEKYLMLWFALVTQQQQNCFSTVMTKSTETNICMSLFIIEFTKALWLLSSCLFLDSPHSCFLHYRFSLFIFPTVFWL